MQYTFIMLTALAAIGVFAQDDTPETFDVEDATGNVTATSTEISIEETPGVIFVRQSGDAIIVNVRDARNGEKKVDFKESRFPQTLPAPRGPRKAIRFDVGRGVKNKAVRCRAFRRGGTGRDHAIKVTRGPNKGVTTFSSGPPWTIDGGATQIAQIKCPALENSF